MAKRQLDSPDPDLLAAVVLQTLVEAGGQPLTHERISVACERRPHDPDERAEIDRALAILLRDRLATRAGDRFCATRPAIRAAQLSF